MGFGARAILVVCLVIIGRLQGTNASGDEVHPRSTVSTTSTSTSTTTTQFQCQSKPQTCYDNCWRSCFGCAPNEYAKFYLDIHQLIATVKVARVTQNVTAVVYMLDMTESDIFKYMFQRYLSALIGATETHTQCIPVFIVQYLQGIAYTVASKQCGSTCEAFDHLRCMTRRDQNITDSIGMACSLANYTVNTAKQNLPNCAASSTAQFNASTSMVVAFTNNNNNATMDYANAVNAFGARINVRIGSEWSPVPTMYSNFSFPLNHKFNMSTSYYLGNLDPLESITSCVKQKCCMEDSAMDINCPGVGYLDGKSITYMVDDGPNAGQVQQAPPEQDTEQLFWDAHGYGKYA